MAITLHLNVVAGNVLLRARARVSLQGLGVGTVASLLVLIPGQPVRWLGVELIALEAVHVVLTVPAVSRLQGLQGLTIGFRLRSATVGLLVASQLAAGVSLAIDRGPGLYLLVPAVLIGLATAFWNAWNTLLPAELAAQQAAPISSPAGTAGAPQPPPARARRAARPGGGRG